MVKRTVTLGKGKLTIEEVVAVARRFAEVQLMPDAMAKIKKSRAIVDTFVKNNEVVYGLTTGFGEFKNVAISQDQTEKLQKNLITSHSVGVGEPFPEEIVRAAILVRINSLLQGYSGVRAVVIETLVEMLNKKIYPYVPCKGSVGSSGDLAPLSHIMLALMGLGECIADGKRTSSARVLSLVKISPVKLSYKEGLALNNGTAPMTGIAALAVYDAENLMKAVDISLSLSMEALKGVEAAYDIKIHEIRPHKGQISTAANVRKLIKGSSLIDFGRPAAKVQDAYTLRCAPQVHGACKDTLRHVRGVVETELNSATDNPFIFDNPPRAISGGNFHGEPIAIAMDILGIAVSEIANISERRIARLVDPHLNEGLPAFLVKGGGLNNGFMIPQYTAAALVSENKVLAHPASVDSIPTSANQEDHVSMGTIAARKGREMIENSLNVIAIELYAAAQGIDFRDPKYLAKGTAAVYDFIRKHVPFLHEDRIMYVDMHKIADLIRIGEIVKVAEKTVGNLEV